MSEYTKEELLKYVNNENSCGMWHWICHSGIVEECKKGSLKQIVKNLCKDNANHKHFDQIITDAIECADLNINDFIFHIAQYTKWDLVKIFKKYDDDIDYEAKNEANLSLHFMVMYRILQNGIMDQRALKPFDDRGLELTKADELLLQSDAKFID